MGGRRKKLDPELHEFEELKTAEPTPDPPVVIDQTVEPPAVRGHRVARNRGVRIGDRVLREGEAVTAEQVGPATFAALIRGGTLVEY